MNVKYGLLCASVLAGAVIANVPASADPIRPSSAAHPRWSHPARPFHPGFVRPGYRFGHPNFHRFIAHRPIARFSVAERARWTRGHWRHAWFHGRFGWWFVAGGGWYFYPQPVYPYPDVVSDTYYEDESGGYENDQDYGSQDGNDSGQNWYYCQNPKGYYPYVKTCGGGWQTVPATPPDQSGSNDDSYGPPDQDSDYDNGPPPDSGPPGQGPDDDYDNGPPPGGPDDYGDDNGPPR